jgi:hypothetical protein
VTNSGQYPAPIEPDEIGGSTILPVCDVNPVISSLQYNRGNANLWLPGEPLLKLRICRITWCCAQPVTIRVNDNIDKIGFSNALAVTS